MLIDSITPKWNPTIPSLDLSDELALTNEEGQLNKMSIDADRVMTFGANFTLENIGGGFRIFAVEESLNEIPARRYTKHYYIFPTPNHLSRWRV
jgi:hypothetical protein